MVSKDDRSGSRRGVVTRCPHCGSELIDGKPISQARLKPSGKGGISGIWIVVAVVIIAVVWLIMPAKDKGHDHELHSTSREGECPRESTDAVPEGHPTVAGGDGMPVDIMGRLDELKARIESDPGDAEALKELGNMYYDIARADRAIEYYGKYLALAPDDVEVHNDIGRMYIMVEDLSSAESHLRKAIELDAGLPQPRVNLGVTLAAQGNYDEAITELNGAIEVSDNAEISENARMIIEEIKQARKTEKEKDSKTGD